MSERRSQRYVGRKDCDRKDPVPSSTVSELSGCEDFTTEDSQSEDEEKDSADEGSRKKDDYRKDEVDRKRGSNGDVHKEVSALKRSRIDDTVAESNHSDGNVSRKASSTTTNVTVSEISVRAKSGGSQYIGTDSSVEASWYEEDDFDSMFNAFNSENDDSTLTDESQADTGDLATKEIDDSMGDESRSDRDDDDFTIEDSQVEEETEEEEEEGAADGERPPKNDVNNESIQIDDERKGEADRKRHSYAGDNEYVDATKRSRIEHEGDHHYVESSSMLAGSGLLLRMRESEPARDVCVEQFRNCSPGRRVRFAEGVDGDSEDETDFQATADGSESEEEEDEDESLTEESKSEEDEDEGYTTEDNVDDGDYFTEEDSDWG